MFAIGPKANKEGSGNTQCHHVFDREPAHAADLRFLDERRLDQLRTSGSATKRSPDQIRLPAPSRRSAAGQLVATGMWSLACCGFVAHLDYPPRVPVESECVDEERGCSTCRGGL